MPTLFEQATPAPRPSLSVTLAKCSLNVQDRIAKGYPAFLSSSSLCDRPDVFLAAKDYGTGRQRWRLKLVAAG